MNGRFTPREWAIHDAQPVEIKRLVWECGLVVPYPVMADNAETVARIERRDAARKINRLACEGTRKRERQNIFARFIPAVCGRIAADPSTDLE
jgi:hypothetical protein